ncbi:uncharacterized protein V1518DRAFT_419187 [Limtongia smithiae]|uniref:uncharacterized protein n=1 Tax=Limtongia smithiae TaxID=1125753 RepID=UPI0034CE66BC
MKRLSTQRIALGVFLAACLFLFTHRSPRLPATADIDVIAGTATRAPVDGSAVAAPKTHAHDHATKAAASEPASDMAPESTAVPVDTATTTASYIPPLDIDFVIPLTSSHFNFCRSLYSALINDYPHPTLINYGNVYEDVFKARVYKIRGIADYLQSQPAEKVAFIMDGFDVWYQLSYREFVDRYMDMARDTNFTTAIFGADKKCWPNAPLSAACSAVPESPLPANAYGEHTDDENYITVRRFKNINFRPRWLNSGNMIGPASVLSKIYERANYSITHAEPNSIFSDQFFIADVYGQQDLPMEVDFYSKLFQTMTFSHRDIIFVADDEMSYPRKSPDKRRMLAFNKISGSLPPILHFNGPKEYMDEWWPKMWWYRRRNDPELIAKSQHVYKTGGAYDIDGTFISWDTLCHGVDVHTAPPYVPPKLSTREKADLEWKNALELKKKEQEQAASAQAAAAEAVGQAAAAAQAEVVAADSGSADKLDASTPPMFAPPPVAPPPAPPLTPFDVPAAAPPPAAFEAPPPPPPPVAFEAPAAVPPEFPAPSQDKLQAFLAPPPDALPAGDAFGVPPPQSPADPPPAL